MANVGDQIRDLLEAVKPAVAHWLPTVIAIPSPFCLTYIYTSLQCFRVLSSDSPTPPTPLGHTTGIDLAKAPVMNVRSPNNDGFRLGKWLFNRKDILVTSSWAGHRGMRHSVILAESSRTAYPSIQSTLGGPSGFSNTLAILQVDQFESLMSKFITTPSRAACQARKWAISMSTQYDA
ncbi:putative Cytochrome P450 [Seiridium cardinale]|uniref:Cytochrome P450 n=1 Tax=Seiridium cardinale TaxID=138064 RepID=A0ABR2XNR0_9PEZI